MKRASFNPPRESYIPAGSVKVADKLSDAVAYIYTNAKGRPCARVFFGKQTKPVVHAYFSGDSARARAVEEAFAGRRLALSYKANRKAERVAYVNDYQVGEILNTCWGYDQTNREFFEVTEIRGKHVILREVAQDRIDTGFQQGQCVPLHGEYIGEPIRRLAQKHSVKIDNIRWAHRSDKTNIGGVDVIKPIYWTAYH